MTTEDFKEISGCGLVGMMNMKRRPIAGEEIVRAIDIMSFRSNGLGAGFAGYGIYPDYKDCYAFHTMLESEDSRGEMERYIEKKFEIRNEGEIPTKTDKIAEHPILWRYFLEPKTDRKDEDEFVKRAVMDINEKIGGAFVASSGKNMGVFKGVGWPRDIARFYRLGEYKAHTWIAHARFPTNTPGWWGGAHPFNILDYSVVHNGEISSYGINRRYLEAFNYKCTLSTDTEVLAYLIDLLSRKHGLSWEYVAKAMAPPFWTQIARMAKDERGVMEAMRLTYGGALVNGPFSIIVGFENGMWGLNDRVKLRPLVAGRNGDDVYLSSEESGIREVAPNAEVWYPKAGEPVIFNLKN